jgi:hypothetical protein
MNNFETIENDLVLLITEIKKKNEVIKKVIRLKKFILEFGIIFIRL